MKPKKPPLTETFIRYGSYPLILGATAMMLFASLAAGWPYFPTVPLTVAAALLCVALLEPRLPFHAAWARDHRDSVCDAIHARAYRGAALSRPAPAKPRSHARVGLENPQRRGNFGPVRPAHARPFRPHSGPDPASEWWDRSLWRDGARHMAAGTGPDHTRTPITSTS